MFKWKLGDDVGALEHWPLTNPSSDYRVRRGNPQTYGRLEKGGAGHVTRMGIWRCTRGVLECTEQGDELMMILSGRCVLTQLQSGEKWELAPGDTFFSRDGTRVLWDVRKTLTKVFYGHKSTGF